MEEFLSFALESGSAVRHDTLSLGGSDLSAKVGLARLAELAFLALGSAVRKFVSTEGCFRRLLKKGNNVL